MVPISTVGSLRVLLSPLSTCAEGKWVGGWMDSRIDGLVLPLRATTLQAIQLQDHSRICTLALQPPSLGGRPSLEHR